MPDDHEVKETIVTIGHVVDCKRLNVRKDPSALAEILSRIEVGSEVMIDETFINSEFFKVTTVSGLEGYCMKPFVSIEEE